MSTPSQAVHPPAAATLERGRLPRTAIPERYRIHLEAYVGDRTFQGTVAIAIRVPEPTPVLIIHSAGLAVTDCLLDGLVAGNCVADDVSETLTLTFAAPIAAGSHELTLGFSGKLETVPFGLHLQTYQESGQPKAMIATQFEPTDARRMFPLWDEPAYRAIFELTVDVPAHFETVSNMPIKSEEPLSGGAKRVVFDPTPSMPSYLLVLCAGELEAMGGQVAGVDVRILCARGKKASGQFALESTAKLLPWFNEYFGVPYALPKLDLIAIPGGFEGAMENWGGITFNEGALLFDPASSSQATKEGIFGIIAHEVAHQWFGNLVTMAWWDDLWLNEGFATWMATKATAHFYPEWEPWPRANRSKNWAMDADARSTTHPVYQTVEDVAVAVSRFDEISYDKGEAVIRMLEDYIGETSFREGIRHYMKAHAYGNSTTADLWTALEEASGKPVGAIARSWIEQPGFPLVTADLDPSGSAVVVRQERFTLNDPDAEPLSWRVPLIYAINGESSSVLFDAQETRLPLADIGATIKLNWGDSGYYRVWHRGELGDRLSKAFPTLPEADRVALLSDSWALALSDRAPIGDYLTLVEATTGDDSLALLQQILGAFDELDVLLLEEPGRAPFHAAARRVLGPLGARLGWDDAEGEPDSWAMLRGRVLATLGRFGDEAVLAEARRRFALFLGSSDSLPGNLRAVVFGVVGRFATTGQYDTLHGLARGAERIEDRGMLYGALAKSRDPVLAARTLAVSLTDEAEPTLATNLVLHVAGGENRDLALAFAKEHLDLLMAKRDTIGRYKFLPTLFESFSEASKADELEAIARRTLPEPAWGEAQKGAERIRFQATLKIKLLPGVARWTKS